MARIIKNGFDKWFSETYPDWNLELQFDPDGIIIRLRKYEPKYQAYTTKLLYGVDYTNESDIKAIVTTNIVRCFENMKEVEKNDRKISKGESIHQVQSEECEAGEAEPESED